MEKLFYIRYGKLNQILEIQDNTRLIHYLELQETPQKEGFLRKHKRLREQGKLWKELTAYYQINSEEDDTTLLIWNPEAMEEKFGNLFMESFKQDQFIQSLNRSKILIDVLKEKKEGFKPEEIIVELGKQKNKEEESLYDNRLRDEKADSIKQLLWPFLSDCNYFTVLTGEPSEYDEFSDWLYAETGLAVQCIEDKNQLKNLLRSRKKHPSVSLYLDLNREACVNVRALPLNCFYLDAWQTIQKERSIAVKRPDIYYQGCFKYLDTILKDRV